VIRTFDPLFEDDQDGEPLPEEEGLPFFPDDQQLTANPPLVAAMLALVARVTGFALTRDWFDEPHSTWTTG